MLSCDVTISPSLTRKLDREKYEKALSEAIGKTANDACDKCKEVCPVDTGNLRDSHESETEDLNGFVKNSANYWSYVVNGTSKMAARNYPKDVVNELKSNDTVGKYFKENIK